MFIKNLIHFLHPQPGSIFLDMACGNGRHARTLNSMGYEVYGVDIAENSIAEARSYENSSLHFHIHDIREPFRPDYFHYVTNLFTSFGYFSSLEENEKVIHAAAHELKAGGLLIIDFMNVKLIKKMLPYDGVEVRDNITFHIHKEYTNKRIIKTIEFTDKGQSFHFEEMVASFELEDFEIAMQKYGLSIKHTFGNYLLGPYRDDSDRLIIIAEKIAHD